MTRTTANARDLDDIYDAARHAQSCTFIPRTSSRRTHCGLTYFSYSGCCSNKSFAFAVMFIVISLEMFFLSSMCRYCGLRSPLQERLLFVIGQTRRMIERGVVSRRHRTAIDGGCYALQCFRFFLRVVVLPIGEIQHSACRVGSEVCRRNRRIPPHSSTGRMAFVTPLPKDRVPL